MPVNPGIAYQKAEQEYVQARTDSQRLIALKKMLTLVPKHKGSEKLQKQIKEKIAKIRYKKEKEIKQKKAQHTEIIKKEGAAAVVLVGTVNSGKSTLLAKLTNSKVKIAEYPFTTKKPELGIIDYKGIKIQVIEVPAIIKNFNETEKAPYFLSLIKSADLIVLLFKNAEEKKLLDSELSDIEIPKLIYNNEEDFKDRIWNKLDLIKVHTKMPGKKPNYPPVALKKGSTIEDLAEHVHKDFIRNFKFARIWGKSAKFQGQNISLNHVLQDEDTVELHLK